MDKKDMRVSKKRIDPAAETEATSYEVEYENLAVPEIHTGAGHIESQTEVRNEEPAVINEFQAIPETHFGSKKKAKTL